MPCKPSKETGVKVIICSPDNRLEEMVFECPDLTWHQVLCELDRLNRAGKVRLTMKTSDRYALSRTAACDSLV